MYNLKYMKTLTKLHINAVLAITASTITNIGFAINPYVHPHTSYWNNECITLKEAMEYNKLIESTHEISNEKESNDSKPEDNLVENATSQNDVQKDKSTAEAEFFEEEISEEELFSSLINEEEKLQLLLVQLSNNTTPAI